MLLKENARQTSLNVYMKNSILGFFGEIMFADYRVDGKIVFANTGEHKSLKVYGKII